MPKSFFSSNRALILRNTKGNAGFCILLEYVNGSWSLPQVQIEGERFYYSTGSFNERLRDTYGVNVTTLRCLDNKENSADQHEDNLYIVECHSWNVLPPNVEWHLLEDLDSTNNVPKGTLSMINEAINWLRNEHSLRVPWSNPGWFAQMKDEFTNRLEELGFPEADSIEQVRTWERSSVLRAKIGEEYLYLKSVPNMFAYEPNVAYWLSKKFPRHAAPVIGHYYNEDLGHYMIMPHYDGRWLDQVQDLHHWEKVIVGYAFLQKSLVRHVPQLTEFGVIRRDIEHLAVDAAKMIADVDMLQTGKKPLSDQEIQGLRSALPAIRSACEQLCRFSVPLSLDHGDLWSGQVVIQKDISEPTYLINDWSDCSITHPFFSIPFFLEDAEVELPSFPNAREYLWGAYARQWSEFEGENNLRNIVKLARLLGPVHNAVVYHKYILPRMEFSWEMQFMYLRHLRKILLAMEILDS